MAYQLIFRVSNTSNWQVFGTYETIGAAREARKIAIADGFRASATQTTQGKILGWDIREVDAA